MKTKSRAFSYDYCLKTWVMGIKHYVPTIYEGSKVFIKREQNNHHDKNAIAVVNDKGERCGYLPRYDSYYLAPLLDRNAIEIVLEPSGERDYERVSIILHVKVRHKGCF